jgi:hypothetical protein
VSGVARLRSTSEVATPIVLVPTSSAMSRPSCGSIALSAAISTIAMARL